MRILFLLQELPYPIKNGMNWKIFHLLKYLSKDWQCDVISFYDTISSIDNCTKNFDHVNWVGFYKKPNIFKYYYYLIVCLLQLKPFSFARYYSKRLFLDLKVLKSNYDVVHYDMVNMAQYFQSDIASVHSPNDATSLFYKKLNAITNSRLIKARLFLAQCLLSRFEKFAYPKFDNVHVLANDDAEYLRSICPGINTTVIPFGVQSGSLLANSSEKSIDLLVLGGGNDPAVSVGIEEFIKTCLPFLFSKFPYLTVRFHGRGAKNLLSKFLPNPDMRISSSDWVDDIELLIHSAKLIILCDKAGTGIKTRAIQSLSCGACIVGTKISFEGLSNYFENQRHCYVVDDICDMQSVIIDLLKNSNLRYQVGKAGNMALNISLTWEILISSYVKLYLNAKQHHLNY
jgi:glycosyltransferase involved in cell wall biosynthesis